MATALHGGCLACLSDHGDRPATAEEQTLTILWMLASGRHTVAEMVMDLCEPHRRKMRRLMDETYAEGTD